ncbi:Kelch repeat-containing protein [Catenulispora sp. EB89]|uniref:Kelch repeat-containing protein n=1 Tax=Catenulispora sp. EB89 TaxID=3156257 RepID=UPI0035129748
MGSAAFATARGASGTAPGPSPAAATSPASAAGPGPASAAGQWATAGTLPAAVAWRSQHDTALPLKDGRVLVVGGSTPTLNAQSAATLYNPAANTWSAAAPMGTSRRDFAAVRLADGRVLVTGGIGASQGFPAPGLASTEIFDPAAGTWTAAADMHEGRWDHTATLLPDGRVLVAGGGSVRSPQSVRSLRSAELFDPATGTWTPAPPMTDARSDHAAVALADGRVLLVGGILAVGLDWPAYLAFCEVYDPAANSWSPTGSMHVPRALHQATLLRDGSVLATGGGSTAVQLDGVYNPSSTWAAERYDPATGQWEDVPSMPFGRAFHRAVPLASGGVLVIGGTGSSGYDVGYQNAAIYDPVARAWTATAGLAVGRWGFAAAPLADGRVLVAGGVVASGVATANPGHDVLTAAAEVYTP